MEVVQTWVDQYGYGVLFFGLFLELIALPIPGEVLMSYSGFLVSKGTMNWPLSIFLAGLGSALGMTLAYGIGYKLGAPFFQKYGQKIHLGPDKLEQVSRWFARYGNKMLIVGYFIPGVRHITGYFSGITRIPYRSFAAYAYLGAFLWTSTFVSLGKVLGPKWSEFHGSITKYLLVGALLAAVILLVVYFYRMNRTRLLEHTNSYLDKLLQVFHSLGRVRFVVAGGALLFVAFFGIMLGLIQDFLGNEFQQFDTIGSYLTQAIFGEVGRPLLQQIAGWASLQVLLPVIGLTFVWIWLKGKNRRLEASFLLFVMVGGEILDEGLRRLFHRVGPAGDLSSGGLLYTFPSEQSFMALIVYGFVAYLLVRHAKSALIHTLAPLLVLVVVLLVGISRVFLGVQYPSDVAAGYVFGGVWLSLNIVLLEVYRQLRNL